MPARLRWSTTAKQPLLLPKHSTGGRFPVPSLSLQRWRISVSELARSMSPGKKRDTAPALSISAGQHKDSLGCRCGPRPPVCIQITLNFYHRPEFLSQHPSWECGAGLAHSGTDRDVPQSFPVCSQSNTSPSAVHVRGKRPSSGTKELPGSPPGPGQSAETAGQGCSQRVESSRAQDTGQGTQNVTWQCPGTGLAFCRATRHCQHCHLPPVSDKASQENEMPGTGRAHGRKRSREVGKVPQRGERGPLGAG